MQVGEDPLHLGRVPLTPEAGQAVVFEPVPLVLTGTATAGDLRINLRGGELRWDLPDWSEQLAADLQALTITYDVTFIGDFAAASRSPARTWRSNCPTTRSSGRGATATASRSS